MVVRLDGPGLARLRLAVSPASEMLAWLRLVVSGRCHPVYGDPRPGARDALRHPDVRLLAQVLLPTGQAGYVPDLLTPKPLPGPAAGVLGRQLAAVAATPGDTVYAQVVKGRFARGGTPPQVLSAVESGSFAVRAANGLRRFWRGALAEQWSPLRATLEAELARQATAMATAGIGGMFAGLHPRLHWTGRQLTIDSPFHLTYDLSGAELVLAPSVMHSGLSSQLCETAEAVLAYPVGAARGSGRRDTAPLAALLGGSRSAVLTDLEVPRSTGELSARLGLAPATVSYHLGILLRSGLVVRAREAHRVLYRRSTDGNILARQA